MYKDISTLPQINRNMATVLGLQICLDGDINPWTDGLQSTDR